MKGFELDRAEVAEGGVPAAGVVEPLDPLEDRSFHNYSLSNLLLILSQNPDATMVAGFRQWQAKGRQVRKGEKSITIFGYHEKKPTRDDDRGDATEVAERVVRSFPTLSVFDVA